MPGSFINNSRFVKFLSMTRVKIFGIIFGTGGGK